MKKKKRKTYIKLFNIPDIARQAMVMLSSNPPLSYTQIAEKLGCDRSSVVHFHQKKIQEGITFKNFNGVKVEIVGGTKPEVINIGKCYNSYLKQYNKESSKLQSKNMKEAKKTINKIKKGRINYDVSFDYEIW